MAKKSTGKTTTPSDRHKKLIDKMNEPLRKKYEEAVSLLTKDAADTSQVRYQVGVIAVEIKDAATYEDRAVERFVRALGMNKATCYSFAAVAETWDKKAVSELLKRKNLYGAPLTFSHLILLAQVKKASQRESLIEAALSGGWPVSTLRRHIKPERPARRRSGKVAIATGLRALLTRSKSLLETIGKSEAAVFSAIDKSGPDKLSDRTLQLLEDAKAKNQELLKACTENVARLDAALEKAKDAVATRAAEEEQEEQRNKEAA